MLVGAGAGAVGSSPWCQCWPAWLAGAEALSERAGEAWTPEQALLALYYPVSHWRSFRKKQQQEQQQPQRDRIHLTRPRAGPPSASPAGWLPEHRLVLHVQPTFFATAAICLTAALLLPAARPLAAATRFPRAQSPITAARLVCWELQVGKLSHPAKRMQQLHIANHASCTQHASVCRPIIIASQALADPPAPPDDALLGQAHGLGVCFEGSLKLAGHIACASNMDDMLPLAHTVRHSRTPSTLLSSYSSPQPACLIDCAHAKRALLAPIFVALSPPPCTR